MAYVDTNFRRIARSILDHGYSDAGMWTRAVWDDNTPDNTIKLQDRVSFYYLLLLFPC